MMSITGRRLLSNCVTIFRLGKADLGCLADLKNMTIVRSVEKPINADTNVFIESPIHIKIKHIDVINNAPNDKLVMQIYSLGKDASDFTVKQTAKRLELINTDKNHDSSDVCVIQVPANLNLHISCLHNASVKISKLQMGECKVNTHKGSISMKDLTAGAISAQSTEGSVSCHGKLQAAEIDLKTGLAAPISCNNILANNFKVTSQGGVIEVKSCYSDNSHFITAVGNVLLDHLHRNCKVEILQHGNLKVTGFDGNLDASLKSGNVFIHAFKFTDKNSIFIHEKGHVDLQMNDVLNSMTLVDLIAEKISVEDDIKELGRMMNDTHPQRFRFPKQDETFANELLVECRNGSIAMKQSPYPFLFTGIESN